MADEYRILALDYGEKRIGVALSDPLRMFAKPFETISNTSYEDVLARVNTLVRVQNVGKIVVGIPWGIEHDKTAKTEVTLAFYERLQADMPVPVLQCDERYSTDEANKVLKEQGFTWQQARKVIDALAACLILKRYLENEG